MQCCPNCSQALIENKCKRTCSCGYLEDCSEGAPQFTSWPITSPQVPGTFYPFDGAPGKWKPGDSINIPLVYPTDPTGKDQHEPGAKLDSGKLRAGLVFRDFARALKAVAEIGTYGANKYTDHGWLSVPNSRDRYTDAKFRHLLDEAIGEELDPESQLPHLAHEAWNSLAILELYLREKNANLP